MKHTFIYFLLTASMLGCSASSVKDEPQSGNTITLKGKVGFPQEGLIILEEMQNSYQPTSLDTILLNADNTYSHEINLEEPGYYRLNFYNQQTVMLVLDKDDVEVNVDGNNRTGFVEVKGSRDHDFINDVQALVNDFQKSEEVGALNQEFGEASQNGDAAKVEELRAKYLELEEQHRSNLTNKFKGMEASLAVVSLLQNGRILDRDKNFDVFEDAANKLRKALPNSKLAKDFVNEVEQMKKLAIGQVAPEIALPNPDGKIVNLSSLRGNYVLVDFWAKWCRPCRAENPNVVRMYNKFNKKGFEVFGVSLDRRKEDWIQAIEEDGLHWTQVSDLKFWQSEAAQIYNVKAIPFALLLDPDGVIIGKNLRGLALEQKLEEIFNDM